MKKQLAASLACLLLLTGCAKAPVTRGYHTHGSGNHSGHIRAYGGARDRAG